MTDTEVEIHVHDDRVAGEFFPHAIDTRSDRAGESQAELRMGKFRANSGIWQGGSTAEQLAEAIYEATTDGKSQLRYQIGADAEQMYGLRKAQGDDAFVAAMKQQMLS